jgi:hypothetical protein
MNILKTALIAGLFAGTAMAQTVYTVGLGGQVGTGGWWYGNAQKGDNTPNTFSCSGNVYDGMTEQPADWGSECETANGQEVTFNIEMGTDAQGYDWGYALIGFDFNENPAGTPDNMKLTYDVTSAGGVCVTYTSPAATWALVKSTDDMDGDAYGFRLMPATSATEVCKTWAELTKQSWSSPWTFNPANATGMQFKIETAGSHTLVISDVTLGTTGGPDVSVLFDGAASSVQFALSGKSLSFKTAQKLNVEVFDMQGRLVSEGSVSKLNSTLNLRSLQQGSYIVRAMGEGVSLQQKIAIVD